MFAVRSDVFHIGRDECGTPLEALAFYVIREYPDGRRLAHEARFINGTKHIGYDGGDVFARDDGKAERQAEILRKRCEDWAAAGKSFDPERWEEIDPAYGSAAYQGLDAMHFFRDREKQEDRDREAGLR
jgi:hypothetical protein